MHGLGCVYACCHVATHLLNVQGTKGQGGGRDVDMLGQLGMSALLRTVQNVLRFLQAALETAAELSSALAYLHERALSV